MFKSHWRLAVSHVREIPRVPMLHLRIVAFCLGLLLPGLFSAFPAIAGSAEKMTISDVIAESSPEDAKALRECISCHFFKDDDIAKQGRMARKKHKRVLAGKKVCVDCHDSGEICCHETAFARGELAPLEPARPERTILKGM